MKYPVWTGLDAVLPHCLKRASDVDFTRRKSRGPEKKGWRTYVPVDRLNGTTLRSCLRWHASRAEGSRFAGQLTQEAPPAGDRAGALTFRFLAGWAFGGWVWHRRCDQHLPDNLSMWKASRALGWPRHERESQRTALVSNLRPASGTCRPAASLSGSQIVPRCLTACCWTR